MRRGIILPTLAAATVVGHLGYHLISNTEKDAAALFAQAAVMEPPLTPAPSPTPAPCGARAPIGAADWQPMAAALRLHLVERSTAETAHLGRGRLILLQRLEACRVQLDGDLTDLHAKTALGETWVGAHFRKNDAGWSVFRVEGGDI